MVKLPHWPSSKEKALITPGLEMILALMKSLGNPHLRIPPAIHVTGTNGKGSTVSFLKYILREAGYKVHTYTSPHLIRFNERICLNGNEISDNFLYEVIEETRLAAEVNKLNPTFFEGTTAAAFLAFSKTPADFIIIETGLGAKFDATNIVENPLVSIITSISLDHVEYLGNSLKEIAFHKSGIIKKNVPCVVAQQYDEVFSIIEQVANIQNSSLVAFEYDWITYKNNNGMIYESKDKIIEIPTIGLVGDHQIMNAGNAISAILTIKDLQITDNHIITGISNTFWPCRIQKLLDGNIKNTLPTKWEIFVDGAHNDAGAFVLSNWLESQREYPIYLIFGMSHGRDVKSFISHLVHLVDDIYVVGIEAEPLSYSNTQMHNFLNEVNITNHLCDSINDALEKIKKHHPVEKAKILVCGSLYLASDVAFINQAMRK